MVTTAYLDAKIGFDPAENEPPKECCVVADPGVEAEAVDAPDEEVAESGLGEKCIFEKCIFRKFCKFLAGSFSAVSKRIFARKYAFDSIFQALQDLHPFAPLQSQNFRKKSVWKISNFCENSAKFLQMLQNLKKFANFQKKIIWIIW